MIYPNVRDQGCPWVGPPAGRVRLDRLSDSTPRVYMGSFYALWHIRHVRMYVCMYIYLCMYASIYLFRVRFIAIVRKNHSFLHHTLKWLTSARHTNAYNGLSEHIMHSWHIVAKWRIYSVFCEHFFACSFVFLSPFVRAAAAYPLCIETRRQTRIKDCLEARCKVRNPRGRDA